MLIFNLSLCLFVFSVIYWFSLYVFDENRPFIARWSIIINFLFGSFPISSLYSPTVFHYPYFLSSHTPALFLAICVIAPVASRGYSVHGIGMTFRNPTIHFEIGHVRFMSSSIAHKAMSFPLMFNGRHQFQSLARRLSHSVSRIPFSSSTVGTCM